MTVSVDGATVPEEIRSFAIANLEEEEEKEKEKVLLLSKSESLERDVH